MADRPVCDRCNERVGDRYTIHFPDGQLEIDLCAEHSESLADLKEYGRWAPGRGAQARFQKVDLTSLRQARGG